MKEDGQLIDEVLSGNSSAFAPLVTKYQDRLYNTLVHVVGCTEEAHDVCQDAFVQALVKLRTFKRRSAFYTWLYRIAFNLAASRKRRRKPNMSIEQNRELTGEEPASHGDAPDERLQREERVAQVQTALAGLTEEFRTVVVLREIEGHDYETIAEMLDLPLGTVRSRLHRGRMELRDQLKAVLATD